MNRLVPFNGTPTPPTREQLERHNLRHLSARGRDSSTDSLVNIIRGTELTSQVVSRSVVDTDTSVGWCPAPNAASPIRFFVASLSRVSVYQLGDTVSVGGDTRLYLPQFLFRATVPFSSVAVPFQPREDTPAFVLGYPGGDIEVAEVAGEGAEWRVQRVSTSRPEAPTDCCCVAWNSHSDLVAVGAPSGRIHIIHLSTHHTISSLRFQSLPARQIRFSSRSCFFSCDGSDTVCHWDLRTATHVAFLPSPPLSCPISGAPRVLGIDVAPDRAACVDQEGRCVLWDTRDLRRPLSLHQGHTTPLPRSDAHSCKPTGVCLADTFLCVGACHSEVALYHTQLPAPLCRHWYGADTFGSATISCLDFSPRAQRIIATDSLGAVKLLTVETRDT